MTVWDAAVIGLGRIGMGYDFDSSGASCVLTHASAFHIHPRFQLVGGVDTDPVKRAAFSEKFGARSFSNVDELFGELNPFVVALAVPTTHHFDLFRQVERGSARVLVCEKPIAEHVSDARQMVEACDRRGQTILVNYMRRFEPGANSVRSLIASGELGQVYKGTVWYSKGLLNNGSHFIDLLSYWLGDATDVRLVTCGRTWGANDPEPDIVISFGSVNVYFLAAREECFSISEVELVGTAGKLQYRRGGASIRLWKTARDPVYSGYTALDENPITIPNDLQRYQFHVLQHLAEYLDGAAPSLPSTGATALRTLDIIDRIRQQL